MGRALEVSVLTFLVLVLAAPSGIARTSAADPGATTWTILLYMADNANPELPWQQNLNDMEAAAQAPGTNIIALVDPFGGGNSTLYRVVHDPGGVNSDIVSQVIDDGGAVIPTSTHNANVASSWTLAQFIGFATSTYQADNYVLILWGHGAVWYGLCPDGTDILTLPELRLALANATTLLGRPLDLVGVDACAEATLEMLYEIHDYARYFVASEKDVPSQGLPYRAILDNLASDVNRSVEDVGRMVAQSYLGWSRNNSFYSATMSLFNLSKMPALIDKFGPWVSLATWYEGLCHSQLQTVFLGAEHYETVWQADFGGILTGLMAATVPVELRMRSVELAMVYQNVVAYSGSFDNGDATDGIRAREPTGAVAYSPSANLSDESYSALQLSSSGWTQLSHMLRRVAQSNTSAPGPELSYARQQDFGVGLFDTLVVTWPTSYPQLVVWLFREQAAGLVPCGEYTASGDMITIHGGEAIGDLIVSASAGSSGSAETYASLGPVPITAAIWMNVTLSGIETQGGQIHIKLTTSLGVLFVNATDTSDHVITIVVLTPRDVRLGDLMVVQIETDEGLVGDGDVLLDSTSEEVTIDLHEPPPASHPGLLIIIMAALAALLIVGFAAVLYLESKKKR